MKNFEIGEKVLTMFGSVVTFISYLGKDSDGDEMCVYKGDDGYFETGNLDSFEKKEGETKEGETKEGGETALADACEKLLETIKSVKGESKFDK